MLVLLQRVAFSLLIFSLFEAGVNGQNQNCSTQLLNQVVYAGDANTMLICNAMNPVAWSVTPTNDELFTHKITNNSNAVDPSLAGFYEVTNSNLNIKTATLSPSTQPPITTAGLYVAQFSPYGSSNKLGAKLVVVKKPISCNCTSVNSTTNRITCTVTYADSYINPTYAKVAWKSDNTVKSTETMSNRTKSNAVYTSTATILTSVSDRPYQCNVSFTKPMGVTVPYIATNNPTFWATCDPNYCGAIATPATTTTTTPPSTTSTSLPTHLPTSTTTTVSTAVNPYQCSPLNLAVTEGAQNAAVACRYPTKVAWSVIPTSDELTRYNVTYYNDVVDPSLANLYGVNQTHLLIKTAQSSPTIPPISTSGLYVIAISGSTPKFGAKVLVVRQGPTCDCRALNSTSVQLTCIVTFADSTFNPISANMTWTSNGNYYTSSVVARTRSNDVFLSTSSITISNIDQAVYRCNLSFTKPDGLQLSYVATNAPDYSAFCTSPYCGLATTTTTSTTTTPTTTTTSSTTATLPSSTFPFKTTSTLSACSCPQRSTTGCPTPTIGCTTPSECQQDDTNLTAIYDECVVQAELYVRHDNCCVTSDFICGVVVTIRDDSRWLIHDAPCTDNKCQMVAVNATCMSNTWKLLDVKKITASGVGDYVKAGNGLSIWQNATDCSETCKRMMILT